jgi:hypothetical protein
MEEKKFVTKNVVAILGILCIILLASTVGLLVYYNNHGFIESHTDSEIQSHTDSEYDALAAQLSAANATISSLNFQLATLQAELANNNTQSTNLNKQISDLQVQINNEEKNKTTLQDYYNSLLYVLNTDNHDLSVELDTANSQITNLQNQINVLNAIGNLSVSTVWVNNQTVSQQAGSYTTWSESASYAGYVSIQVSSSSTSITFTNVTYSSHGVNYNTQINVGTNGTAYFPILPSSNIIVAVGNGLSNGNATENVTITYYY